MTKHCTPEQSQALKDVGFDILTRDFFLGGELFYGLPFDCKNWNEYNENTSAPTRSEVLQWARGKHGIDAWVRPQFDTARRRGIENIKRNSTKSIIR